VGTRSLLVALRTGDDRQGGTVALRTTNDRRG